MNDIMEEPIEARVHRERERIAEIQRAIDQRAKYSTVFKALQELEKRVTALEILIETANCNK